MRETLFRAAQPTGTTPSEELVGQFQDLDLTDRCWSQSLTPVPAATAAGRTAPALILWPYPAGTADCIDRANCADHFVRANPGYHVLTAQGLADPAAAAMLLTDTDVVVFLPFEAALDELAVHGDELKFRGRCVDAVMSELTPGYLWRRGVLDINPRHPRWPLTTRLVNGSLIATHKGLQGAHFTTYSQHHDDIAALETISASTAGELAAAIEQTLTEARAAVIRPFSASQGTGVRFVDQADVHASSAEEAAERILVSIGDALAGKYGGSDPFPLTVSAFIDSARIHGCVTDLRIFVTYDPSSAGVRALPGMVRRAQIPLADTGPVTAAAALTNLNAPPAAGAIAGRRFFPATAPDILAQLGLTGDALVRLCRHAAGIWATALTDETGADAATDGQFAYGSVDYLIRRRDGVGVPVEMNGANVGSHPTVHPRWCDAFGAATTHALSNLGLAR